MWRCVAIRDAAPRSPRGSMARGGGATGRDGALGATSARRESDDLAPGEVERARLIGASTTHARTHKRARARAERCGDPVACTVRGGCGVRIAKIAVRGRVCGVRVRGTRGQTAKMRAREGLRGHAAQTTGERGPCAPCARTGACVDSARAAVMPRAVDIVSARRAGAGASLLAGRPG